MRSLKASNAVRYMQMAGVSLLVSIANIVFNFVLVAILKLGVAGTAFGTALAQLLTFAVVIWFRLRTETHLKPRTILKYPLTAQWRAIFVLGAPQSLNFAGIALGSAATFASLQSFGVAGYEITVAAFGILTRIMHFACGSVVIADSCWLI